MIVDDGWSWNILLRANKDTLDVQIHDFLESILGVLVEFLSPCCSCVGEEDIHFIRVLLHLFDQSLDFAGFRNICGDGDGFAVPGKGVEGGTCFLAGFRFAGGDEDLGAAGLGEAKD